MSRYLKKPPSVLKILFQRGSYDRTSGGALKNEVKVAIPSEYLNKQQSSNEKISYTLVSLIKHDGDSLDCGHYGSDFFIAVQKCGGTVMMTISLKLSIYQKGFII